MLFLSVGVAHLQDQVVPHCQKARKRMYLTKMPERVSVQDDQLRAQRGGYASRGE